MSALTEATLVIETAYTFTGGAVPAVRVIPHDEEGKKPRGNAGKGVLILANEGETHVDLLRTVAGYYEQEGSWASFSEIMANRGR